MTKSSPSSQHRLRDVGIDIEQVLIHAVQGKHMERPCPTDHLHLMEEALKRPHTLVVAFHESSKDRGDARLQGSVSETRGK